MVLVLGVAIVVLELASARATGETAQGPPPGDGRDRTGASPAASLNTPGGPMSFTNDVSGATVTRTRNVRLATMSTRSRFAIVAGGAPDRADRRRPWDVS